MKPAYQSGETMIIEIQGNILQPIQPSDVLFKRNNVQLAPQYDIKRIGEKYFLYAQIRQEQFSQNINYTLYINNIDTTVNGAVGEVDFNQSFIVSGNNSEYSINPGFLISADDLRFTITLNTDIQQSINVDFPEEQSINLNPGQNQITLPVQSVSPGFRLLNIGKYQIPVMILSQPIEQNSSNVALRFFPPRIESTILFGQSMTYPFRIINEGDSTISQAYFEFDSSVFEISPQIIQPISKNQSAYFNLTIKNPSISLSSLITVKSGLFSKSMPVLINLTQNVSETKTPYLENNNSQAQYYCQELGGVFCAASEVCSIESVPSLDGSCCLGECVVEEESSYGWLGWVFLAIAVMVIAFVVMKYVKGKKQQISPMQKSMSSPISFKQN